jgi:hypothetical protein
MIFRKRPVYTIGQGMAAARAAEAARIASGPPRESPLPAVLYARTADAQSLLHVDENEIDRRLRSIATDFGAATEDERARITASIDLDGLYAPMLFASRSAVFALRQRDMQRCIDGLRAVAMIDLARIDARDIGNPLAMLDQAAFRLEAKRDALFGEAEQLASPDVSKAIRNYRRANSPRSSLWQFVETPAGAGFVFRQSGNYRPKADLLAIAMAISVRLKTGRHVPGDPTIGSDLPAVWFAPEERRRWKVDVEDAGAGVSFHARLRPGADTDPSDQLLMVFLAELPTAERAAALASAARGPMNDGGAALAISEGNLLLLVVGESIRQGVRSFETPASVRDLIESLRPLLKTA